MKKFNITVNGTSYEVDVEEIGVSSSSAPRAAAPVKKAAPKAAPAKKVAPAKKAPAAAVPAGANTVTAPMPGTVLSINVAEGDVVKNGQVLLILEAMKMENEIMAPADGTIASIQIASGASVSSGDVLIVME